jgi:proteasome accessory factor B
VQTGRGVALKPLAEKHNWKLRNLYRDIEVLEAAGFPIRKENGLYRMDRTMPAIPGAPSADERLALFLARDQAAGWKHTSLGKALDKLWHRIAAADDGQTALFPIDSAPWLSTREWRPIDYGRHAKIVETLEHATRDRIAVQTRYRAASTRQLTSRVIEPGQLHWDPALETLYLIGFCRLRADVRVFAVHRFLAVTPTDQTFAARAETRSRAALAKAFRVWRSERVQNVRIWFAPDIAEEIRERRWLANQRVADDRGGIVLSGEVAGLPEVERWILGYGGAARVLEPRELRQSVAAKLRAGAAAYGEKRLSRTDNGEA